MKTKYFRHSVWIFLIICMVGFSCKKENNGLVLATFTGIDFTMTPCSGGYFFTIDSTKYRAFDIVKNSILNDHTKFPKTYLIKYEKPTGGCYDFITNLVKITEIKNP